MLTITAQATAQLHLPTNLTVKLGDSGNCFASLSLLIGQNIRIVHDETWDGHRETNISLQSGTYSCLATIRAYRSGLGGIYNSFISLNGQNVLAAAGELSAGIEMDVAFVYFTLVV